MVLMRWALLVSFAASGHLAIGQEIDQLPIVNVRLKPPVDALPQVTAEIALLEGTRKDKESANLQALDLAFQQAVKRTSSTIAEVVSSAFSGMPKRQTTSLLEIREVSESAASESQSVSIEVHPPHEPDVSIKVRLDQLEHKRSADEEHLFEQAVREFAVLDRIFTSEVRAQLSAHANLMETHRALDFLQTSKEMRRSGDLLPGLNVRLTASSQVFPTIEGLALAMEGRRDASEEGIRNHVLELESQFFKTSGELLQDAVRKALFGVACFHRVRVTALPSQCDVDAALREAFSVPMLSCDCASLFASWTHIVFRVCLLAGSCLVAQRKANVIIVNCHWLVASMRSFILLSCVVLCHSAWPIPFALQPEALPNVEVSLDAPSNPLPDISAEVSKFETDREDKQAINHDKLVRAFNTELFSARLRIASVFDEAEQQFEHRQHKGQRTLVRVPGDAVEPTTSLLNSNIVKVVVAPHKHMHDSADDAIAQFAHAREYHMPTPMPTPLLFLSRALYVPVKAW